MELKGVEKDLIWKIRERKRSEAWKVKKRGGGEEMTFEPLNLKSDRLLNLNWILAPESTSTGTHPPATPSSSSSGGTASSPPVQSQRKVLIKVINDRT